MLTHIDIHYLVGLLTLACSPENVDIELGDMIYDIASETERDIDVSVKSVSPDGKLTLFRCYEVKDHKRPLDVAHVEQLCAKFGDMPDIGERAIVSASGFTEPAIKKAIAHGVELYHLRDWDVSTGGFQHIVLPANLKFTETSFQWFEPPNIMLLSEDGDPTEMTEFLNTNPTVVMQDKNKSCLDTKTLCTNLMNNAANGLPIEELRKIPSGSTKTVSITIAISDLPSVERSNKTYVFTHALLTGKIVRADKQRELAFKTLVKNGDAVPYAGCCVAELTLGNLCGFSLSNTNRELSFVNIPVSDRNKSKIFRQRISRSIVSKPNRSSD